MPWEHGPCPLWALQTSPELQALPTQGSQSRSFLTGVREATAVLRTHTGGQRAARATGSPQWTAQAGARMQVCTHIHLSVHIPCSPPGDTEHSSTWRQPLSRNDIYNQSASSSPGWRTDPPNSVPSEWWKDKKRASVLLLETEDRWQVTCQGHQRWGQSQRR